MRPPLPRMWSPAADLLHEHYVQYRACDGRAPLEMRWAGLDAVADFCELLLAVVQKLPAGFEPPGRAGIAQRTDLRPRVVLIARRRLTFDDIIEPLTGATPFA